jgi:predicted signal transduction protein with EAL and GGDEF domain
MLACKPTPRLGSRNLLVPDDGYNGAMSVYTITLTPEEDAALWTQARQAGRAPEDLLGQAVRSQFMPPSSLGTSSSDSPSSEAALWEEYHALADLRRADNLSPVQAARLRAVEEALDAQDVATPESHRMEVRMTETADAIDQMLHTARTLAVRHADG